MGCQRRKYNITMSAHPPLTVLMPTYNAAATLDEALESLRAQTFGDFVILAVDDGSTDATPALLAAWQQREPRLRVLRQSHRGVAATLQSGLEAADTPLIARMDADDRAHPDRFARQVAFLEAHPNVAVLGTRARLHPEGFQGGGMAAYLAWQNRLLTDEAIRREIFIESPLVHPTVMFRRAAVMAAGGYRPGPWLEDYDLWLRLYLRGARFAKLPEVLLDWRDHPHRVTRTDHRASLENMLRLKARYLAQGPLRDRDAVIVWGAGMAGRRLSKHLLREGVPLTAFVDIDPRKIGRTRRGRPIYAAEALPDLWRQHTRPAVVVAVGARHAKELIRPRLTAWGLVEGEDWWFAA